MECQEFSSKSVVDIAWYVTAFGRALSPLRAFVWGLYTMVPKRLGWMQ